MLQKEMQNCSDYLYILHQLFVGCVRLWMYSRFKMQINPQSSWWQRISDTYRHLGPRPIRLGSPSPRHTANPLRYTSPDPCKQTAWGCRFLELQKRRGKTKNEWLSQQCIQLLASQTYVCPWNRTEIKQPIRMFVVRPGFGSVRGRHALSVYR